MSSLFQKIKNPSVLFIGIIVLGMLYLLFSPPSEKSSSELSPPSSAPLEKKADIIFFGQWEPSSLRSVFARIESAKDLDVSSQISGTLDQINVSLGQKVSRGEVLATLKKDDNDFFVQYQNALSHLEITQKNAENSIRSAEIAVKSAQEEKEQIQLSEIQNQIQNFEILLSNAKKSENPLFTALDWSDELLGATSVYRSRQDPTKRYVGNNNALLQQKTKNDIQETLKNYNERLSLEASLSKEEILLGGENRLALLKRTRSILEQVKSLIRETNLSSVFSQNDRSAFEAQATGHLQMLNGEITALTQNLEASKSGLYQTDRSLLSAENRLKNAQASLELARSSAQAQIKNAENQLKLSQLKESERVIHSPFEGIITEVFKDPYEKVTPGEKLFSLTSLTQTPKIVGHLSETEWKKIQNQEEIQIKLSDKKIYSVDKSFLSYKINPLSQKIKVEFEIDEKSFPSNILVGDLAEILIPLSSPEKNLLPLSAVSFEPGGAEVFVLNEENKVIRKKIEYSGIFGDAITITKGLPEKSPIIQYKNQVNVGDKIIFSSPSLQD